MNYNGIGADELTAAVPCYTYTDLREEEGLAELAVEVWRHVVLAQLLAVGALLRQLALVALPVGARALRLRRRRRARYRRRRGVLVRVLHVITYTTKTHTFILVHMCVYVVNYKVLQHRKTPLSDSATSVYRGSSDDDDA